MARHKAFSGGVFGQHKPLEAIAKPCSCFSAQTKEGVWGSLRPRLYVIGVQKCLLAIGSTPTDLAKVVGIGTGMLGVNVIRT